MPLIPFQTLICIWDIFGYLFLCFTFELVKNGNRGCSGALDPACTASHELTVESWEIFQTGLDKASIKKQSL